MTIEWGPLTIDRDRYQVTMAGAPLRLTYQEFNALWFIAVRDGRVTTYDELALELWGRLDPKARRRLAVLVSRLRAKLGSPFRGQLDTVSRVGYRLIEPV